MSNDITEVPNALSTFIEPAALGFQASTGTLCANALIEPVKTCSSFLLFRRKGNWASATGSSTRRLHSAER